ncbi:amine sulfotransferase-like [Haemaphysalis longicornis]
MAAQQKHSMFQIIDGERFIFFRDPARVREAFRFQAHDGDIIQIAYPKCGMQLMQQMIQLIVNQGRSADNFREFSQRAPFLEDVGDKAQKVTSSPRVFRSHIRLGRIAVSPHAKYVYVARNPWDACYSQFVMNQKMPLRPMRETFDKFLDMFLDGSLTNGCYFEHVHTGYARRNDTNVFFTTYEDLKLDTATSLLRLADFIDPVYSKRIRQDNGLLNGLVRLCDTDHLRKLLEVDKRAMVAMMFNSPNLSESEKEGADLEQGTLSLICRPEVGCWSEVFTKLQLKKMASKIEASVGKAFVKELWCDQLKGALDTCA